MAEILIGAWFVAGLTGCYLVWLHDRVLWNRDWRCPSPKNIVVGALMSWAGAVALLCGALSWFMFWIERRPKKQTWWTRPLCGDDH